MDNEDYKKIIVEALQFIYDRCWLPCIDSHVDGETFLSMKPDEVEMLANILQKYDEINKPDIYECSDNHYNKLLKNKKE